MTFIFGIHSDLFAEIRVCDQWKTRVRLSGATVQPIMVLHGTAFLNLDQNQV